MFILEKFFWGYWWSLKQSDLDCGFYVFLKSNSKSRLPMENLAPARIG